MKKKPRSSMMQLLFRRLAVLLSWAWLLRVGETMLQGATIFYYNPQNTTGDIWSSGTNWNLVPASSFPTQLVFGPAGTFTGAINNINTNDIAATGGGFLVSSISLRGTGATGVSDTITINSGAGKFLNLDSTIPLGNPQISLDANSGAGGGTLSYNIASNISMGSISGGGLPVNITGNGTARFEISGVISGTLGLTKSGSSTIIFSGVNSYSGSTSVLGGTLIVGANALSGANGALGNSVSAVIVGDVSGTKSAAFFAGGAFTVGRDITIQAGSSGSATLGGNTDDNSSFTGNITLNKNVTLQSVTTGTNAVTFNSGVISGVGFGVIKSGSGTVILGGANTYTGSTTVNQGTLKAGIAGQAFGINSAVTLANASGAVIDITGYNNTIGSLAGGGATGGNVVLGSATLTIGADNTNTSFAGAVSGSGNIVKTGTGTLTLSGASFFSGTTSVLSGTLQIGASVTAGSSGPLGKSSNAVVVGDVSGTNSASLVTGGAFSVARDITVQAGSTGIATLGGATDNNSSFTGNIALNKAVTVQSVTTGANAVTFNTGTISGGGAITKSGSGVAIFGGMNTYTGATNVTQGTLRAGIAGQAFGVNSAVVLTNTNGVTLDLNGYNNSIGSLAGGGAVGGNVTLGSGTLTLGGNGTSTTFSGTISGAGGITKIGTGTQTLSGTGTYTGATTVNGGTLLATSGTAIGDTSAVILANIAGASFQISASETVGSLAGGGSLGGNVSLSNKVLTAGGDNTSTSYGGVLSGAGGGLTKAGTGVMTLTGSNTYTGATTINAGTLKAGVATQAFGVNSAITLVNTASAILDITGFDNSVGSLAGGGVSGGNIILGSNTLTIGGNGTSTTYSGVISGSGNISKTGAGIQTLGRANTYTGTTTVSAGTLKAGVATNAFGNNSAVIVNTGGTLDLSTFANTIGSLSGNGGNVTLGAILTTGGDNTSTNYAGTISGASGITKVGSGTQTLSHANTYTGATAVNAGTLQAGAAGTAFGSNSAVTLANTAGVTLDLNGFNETIGSLAGGGTTGGVVTLGSAQLTLGGLGTSGTFSGVISGINGGITKTGTGIQTLSGTDTYTGSTKIAFGTVKLGAGGKLSSSSSLEFIISGTFNFNNTDPSASQTINTLTFTAGDGTVLSTFGSGTNTLTFTSQSTRQPGATGNLMESGGTALTNQIVIASGQTPRTLINSGIFFNGGSYAVLDPAGYVRAYDYSLDNNASSVGAATTLGAVNASSNVKATGDITAQTTTSVNTLNLSGTNTLTIQDSAALTVNGILKTSGTTTINGGVNSTIGAGNNQELVIRTDKAADTLIINASIAANGVNALTKSGTGTLVLSGSNSYSGVTTINAGVVQINGQNSLGDASATNTITFNGGTLQSTGNTYDLGVNRNITLNTGATIQVDAGTLTISGNVTNGSYGYGAGSLTKTGAGTLILAGSNSYTGAITVNGGLLKAGSSSPAFGSNSALTLANTAGVGLDISGFDNTVGSLAGGGASGGNLAIGGNTLTTGGNGTTTVFSGVISGAGGSIVKVGGGKQTFSGSNAYTGSTTVSNGTLAAGVLNQAFGVNSAVTVNTGGTLDITGFSNTIGSLAGNGGAVTLGAATLTTGGDNSSTAYAGVIGGTGTIIKVGTVTMTLGGSNAYTGTTQVSGGTLKAGVAAKAFGTGANLTLDNTAGVLVDLNNFSNTIGALSGGGTTGGNITLGNGTLTLGNALSTSFAGNITGAGGLTKLGAGTQTLSGSNSFTGATTINAGTLAVSGGYALADTTAVTFANTAGAILLLNSNETVGSIATGGAAGGNISLGSNTLTIGGANTSTSYAGAISGTGGLTKIGTGTQTLTGINTYSGATTINAGTITVSGSNAIADTSAVILANLAGASFQVNSTETVGSIEGGGASGGNVGIAATMFLTIGGNGNSTAYSGVISGAGGLTKTGAGTQTFSGINTYSGTTTVQSGTLALATASTTGIGSSPTLLIGDTLAHNTATLDVTGVTNVGGFHILSGQTAAGFGTYNAGAGKSITVDAGAHWAPGASGTSVGVNTVTGNLVLSGISDFTLGTPGSSHAAPGNSDRTNVSGSLTLGGTLNLLDNAGIGTDGSFGGGSYQIFSQTGYATGSFATINNIGASHAKVDTSTSGAVMLDIYRQAAPLISTVNLASVHIGDPLGSKAVTIINNNPNDGYTEGLNATLINATGALAFSGTSVVNLTGTDNTSYTVSLAGASTVVAGHKTGTVQVQLASNGTNSGYGDTVLTTQTLTVAGDVFRYATPNSITSTIDLGYIHMGSTFNNVALTITNGSVNDGFSEGLDASTATPTGDAVAYGSPLINLFGTSTAISVGVDTTTAGTKSGTVPVVFASDGTYSVLANTALGTQTVTVTGQVYSGQGVWNTNGGGTWSDISKWTVLGGSPGLDSHCQTGDTATFGSAITGTGSTVSLNGNSPSISTMTFDNASASYTIDKGTGNGVLKLNGGASAATIADNSGSHTVSAPVELDTNVVVSVSRANDTLTLSGSLTGTGAAGLTKSGAGTLNMAGVSSYSGATTINAGTVVISGTLSNTASVTVAQNATLVVNGQLTSITNASGIVAGSGTMGDITINDGGLLTPGNNGAGLITIGALTFSGSAAQAGFELGGTLAGVNYDQIHTTGPVLLNNATLDITLMPDYTPGGDETWILISNSDPTSSNIGTFQGLTDGSLVTASNNIGTMEFILHYQDLNGDGGTDVSLTADGPIQAIPEPSTWAMLVAGTAFLLVHMRRKFRKQQGTYYVGS